jgi:hypothetical protein
LFREELFKVVRRLPMWVLFSVLLVLAILILHSHVGVSDATRDITA